MQFIDLNAQYNEIKTDINRRIQQVLDGGQYIMGNEVTELEQALARRVGVKHCIAVANGTDALLIAMMALGIKPGDEIITPAFSYIAVAEMAALYGITPVLVDVDKDTYNMDPACIEAGITEKTRAIIPVSLYGQCADFDEINALAAKYNLPVIEDAAQSLGAIYKGQQSCSLTTIATTSFFPSKPLGCYGDGGACFTDDDELALKMQQIRSHGQDRRYHHIRIGMNSRLDTLQAAILLAKLEIFDAEIQKRQDVANTYTQLLKNKAKTPVIKAHNQSSYAQYTLQVDDRKKICDALGQLDIPTAVHYPLAIHQQPGFSSVARVAGSVERSEQLAQSVVSLPMHPYLKQNEIEKIVDALIHADQ